MTEKDNSAGLSSDNPTGQNLFAQLVTSGLGYCCVHAFFTRVQATLPIADRLGLSSRTIRIHKARWQEGLYPCRKCPSCLHERIKKGPA